MQGTNAARPPSKTREDAPGRPPSIWRELGALGIKIAIILAIALIVFTFIYGLHYNVDDGMKPALKDGDLAVYYRFGKSYTAGDLVVLNYLGQTQVRRVVATAGDVVDITQEGLSINGALQQEVDIYEATQRYDEGVNFPITLEEGQIFVLGDARLSASDSRIYGALNVKDTMGTVIAVIRRRSL